MRICLDAYAVICWLQSEPGADALEARLAAADTGSDHECLISAVNLGEVFYRLARLREPADADRFWREVDTGAVPLRPVDPTRRRIREAARLKATHPISYADAFATQLALEKGLPLMTGDPEIHAVRTEPGLDVVWIGSEA